MWVVLAWLFAGVTVALGCLLVLLWRSRSALVHNERRSRLSAEHARLHLSVLARAGDEMSGALESYDDAVRRLAGVVVPTFADWFSVDLLDEGGEVNRVVAAGLEGPQPPDGGHLHPDGDALVRRVVESGREEVLAKVAAEAGRGGLRPHDGSLVGPGVRSGARPVDGVESMVIVPVHVRGLTLGALSFVTGPGRRGYRLSDLETAHGLADRVAVAVERVLLWRESRGAEEEAIARADQLRRLMEAALAVNAPLAEAEILRVLADHARKVLGAKRAAVCTLPRTSASSSWGDEPGVMAAVCSPEVAPDELGDVIGAVCPLIARFDSPLRSAQDSRVSLGAGPSEEEPEEPSGGASAPMVVEGLPEGAVFDASGLSSVREPWIAVPVPSQGVAVRRVIVVEGAPPGRAGAGGGLQSGFGAPDESVLVLLAQIASVALVNADLYQEVRGSERRLRAVVDASPLAIAELSLNADVRWCNKAWEELVGAGTRSGETSLRLALREDSRAAWDALLDRSSRGAASVGVDITCAGAEELPRELSVSSAPLFDNEGRVSGIVVVAQDVTENRRFLEQIHQSERLAAMARLAGGVAHDFNNLLTVILGATDLLSRREDADESWREELASIQRAGQRASALTAQLLAIGRRREAEPEVLDPASELSSMVPMLERILGDDIRVVVAAESRDQRSRIFLDPADLERAVLNLAINARDAMQKGGTFTLTTRLVEPDQRPGDGSTPSRAYVDVVAEDTGEGMDPETAKRCFEPFFSTKTEGRGTGLGLFAVHAIVTQAGGHASVESSPGHGTRITLTFPALDEDRSAALTRRDV